MESPLDVFISYVPEDDDLRKEFEGHLTLLKRDRVIRAWHQRLIAAGSDFRRETGERLHSARVIVLLVSASYLASDRYDDEMTVSLARAREGVALVIPVLLHAYDLSEDLFAGLVLLPRDKPPVTSWPNRHDAWASVVREIREAIEALDGWRKALSSATTQAPEPRYEDSACRALAKQIDAARARRKALLEANASAANVDAEILDLRRRLREGGRLRAGDTLEDGRYLLIELIGSGGFASVWSAIDREGEGERVAIKVLHAEMARDESRRERFFRGARVMAGLGHEAVVRVLSSRGDDGGWLYFVMELVAGGDLHRAVVRGGITRDHAVPILLNVGEALAEAHAKGVVHRDVKPGNILLDAFGAPKLTDFDLVAADDTTGGTRTGTQMGTYLFMAPEQSSNAKSVDARADVYGLGMTAMFCLHGGELPQFTLRNPERVIERLSCTGPVKAVLTRAIELDPGERFMDARAFCEALQEAASERRGPPPLRERVSGTEGPRTITRTSKGDGNGYGGGSADGSGRGDGSGYGGGSADGSGRGDGSRAGTPSEHAPSQSVQQEDIPRDGDLYVDPSKRTVAIGGLTFQLHPAVPGVAPDPANITFTMPQAGPVAGSWDVYLNGSKVGWFGITAQRKDGVFRVAEARTYVSSLPPRAHAEFVAHAWVAHFGVGDSPLPKLADQIARTFVNNVPPLRSVDVSRMPAAIVAKIKARPVSRIKFSHQDGDREAESFMRNMMSVARSLDLPVDPVEGVRIGSGWIGAVVFLSKDSESADTSNPLRVLAEWVSAQGHSDVAFNGREVDGVYENEIYIAARPLR